MTDVRWDAVQVVYRGGRTVGPASMSAAGGRVLGLVGANGAGKTTLLKALCGLVPAATGSVTVDGAPVRFGTMPQSTGAMIEEPAFLPRATALDNLGLAAGGRRSWLDRRSAVLAEVGLASNGGERVAAFSQGMRQRLGIARVLLADPQVIVLDEPTNGLDPQGIRWARDLVRRLAGQGRTVILSSHLLAEVEVLSDDIGVVEAGTVAIFGPAAEVLSSAVTLENFYFESTAAAAREPAARQGAVAHTS